MDNFLDLFTDQVRRNPHATAASDGRDSLSYRELDEVSDSFARQLDAACVAPGDIVAIGLERGLGFLVSMIGLFKVGAAYLPLDRELPRDRRAYMLEQCSCKWMIAEDTRQAQFDGVGLLAMSARFEGMRGGEPYERCALADDSLAYVIFTSGSTGMPKGAMVHHAGMVNHLLAKVDDLGMRKAPNVAQTAPQSFDISVWQFLAPLICAGRTAILTRSEFLDLDRLGARIEQDEIDILQVVPSHLLAILDAIIVDTGNARFDRLTCLVATGEVLPVSLARRWLAAKPHVPLVNAYGPTECSDDVTHQVITEMPSTDRAIPIGRAVRGVRLSVRDTDQAPLPVGEVGELYVEGIAVGLGYIGRPDLTLKAFVTLDGRRAYRTGDLVSCDSDGVYHYHGRTDDQVKVRGHRIELSEVEFGILRLANVKQAAVVLNSSSTRAFLTAFIVIEDGADTDLDRLRLQLREHLPEHMIASEFRIQTSLPETPNGKIDKKKLTAIANETPVAVVNTGTAATNGQTSIGLDILEIWRELLGNRTLQPADDFFRHGADSILALQFIARAKASGQVFTLGEVFRNPTTLGLLKAARNRSVAKVPAQTPCENVRSHSVIEASSFLPMSPAQRGIFVQSLRSRHRSTYILQYSFRLTMLDGGAALEAGWHKVHQRHELLRSAFILDPSSQPVRVVVEDAPLRWAQSDLSHLSDGEQRTFLETFLRVERQAGFVLEQPALYRLHLFKLADDEYQLVLSAHHLIVDGASIFPLMSEVFGGQPAAQDAYSTYIADPEKFHLQATDQLLWVDLLAPFEGPVCVSDGSDQPSQASVQHVRLRKRLATDLTQAIGSLCVRTGVRISAVAATAWAMALNAVCGGQHQLFGMIVSGRAETGVGLDDFGMYANTLPMPIALYPEDRAEVSLQDVSRRIAELLRFESVAMNEVLTSTRSRFANEAFDTVLNVETLADWATLESAGNRVELTHVTDLTEFPFAVEVLSRGDSVSMDFIWDPERVSRERAAALSEQFLSALTYLCNPDAPLQAWQSWKVVSTAIASPAVTPPVPMPSEHSSFDAPVLAAAREIIGNDALELHHNFFSSGGDSISALQLIARLRRDAMAIDLDRIFASRSLAEIARAVRYLDNPHGAQSIPAIGPTSLVPVQRWFAEQPLVNPNHWCLGTAIELHRCVPTQTLVAATQKILEHYPVLSAQFKVGAEGYVQTIPARPVDGQNSCKVVPLSGTVEQGLDDIRQSLSDCQQSLDLAAGDLLRVVLFRTPDNDAALLVVLVHHLVVDGVSLRILVEDVLNVFAGTALATSVTSFRSWAQQLTRDGQAFKSEVLAQTAYWSEVVEKIPSGAPFDPHKQASRCARTVSRGLSVAQTNALVRDVPAAYNTRINDILISALVRAFSGWQGKNAIAINLEGHGRENVLEGVDISRTVGWFTSVFPVCLEDPQGELDRLIQQTKRTLAQIPQRGIGYGLLRYLFDEASVVPRCEPMVQFNYLGQWDHVSFDDPNVSMPSAQVLSLVDQVSVDPRNGRQHALEIEARIAQGRFEIDWHFDEAIVSAEDVEDIASRYCAALDEIIVHCCRASQVRVPSDYPDADLTDDELRALISHAGAVPEDIYPLAPTQKGILFQHLMSDDDTYILQYTLDIHGEIDLRSLERAWRLMTERHPILRSGFYWDAVSGPVQYVAAEHQCNWSVIKGNDDPALFDRVMENDRARGFDLETPALTRFTLLSADPNTHKLIWTYHHILLDGWCVARVIKELFALYDDLIAGVQPAPTFGRVYRDYIEWLAHQEPRENRPFWRDYLAGIKPCAFISPLAYQACAAVDHRAYRFTLGRDLSRAIERFCIDHGVTVAVVFQCMWARILAQHTGHDTAVFGWAISGRPTDLEGAADIIGLMTSIVPCKVDVAAASTISGVRELQRRNAVLQEEGHVAMSHFKSASGLGQEEELFNTVLVVENFELQDNLPAGDRYRLSNLQWVERSEFALVLGLVPADDFLIELNFNHEKFSVAQMADLQERIVLELALLSSLGNGNLEHEASLQCESVS